MGAKVNAVCDQAMWPCLRTYIWLLCDWVLLVVFIHDIDFVYEIHTYFLYMIDVTFNYLHIDMYDYIYFLNAGYVFELYILSVHR